MIFRLPWNPLVSENLDWIQVEVTTRCNAACTYCARTIYKDKWQDRDFTLKDFKRLRPTLERTNLVYLQGWGEPFLNPEYFDMVKEAKTGNLKVGSTTNGMLLDREMLIRVVEEGLDDLAFSLAGVEAESNDRIRRGTRLEKVLAAMDELMTIKAQRSSETPVIRVAYMLLRSNMGEVMHLPGLLARHGVTDTVVSPLSFICDQKLEVEALTPETLGGKEYSRLKKKLFTLSMASAFQGISLFYHSLSRKPKRMCTENVAKSLVVGAGGDVSPCVLTQLPVRGRVNYRFQGRDKLFEPFILGSIHDRDPMEMRKQPEFGVFLKGLRSRNVQGNCAACWKRHASTE